MKYTKDALLFAFGGGAYVALELLWRRRSHVSMFGAGGLSFLLMGKLEKKKLPLLLRALAGSGVITAVELGTGLVVNREHQVWDYRRQPGNFRGQICPGYSLLWAPVAVGAMELHRLLEGRFSD